MHREKSKVHMHVRKFVLAFEPEHDCVLYKESVSCSAALTENGDMR
jgi:hypothetical protein